VTGLAFAAGAIVAVRRGSIRPPNLAMGLAALWVLWSALTYHSDACRKAVLRIPMMWISHSDLMPIRSERSDAGLFQCETVIDIRRGGLAHAPRQDLPVAHGRMDRAVEVQSGHGFTSNPLLPDQPQQGPSAAVRKK